MDAGEGVPQAVRGEPEVELAEVREEMNMYMRSVSMRSRRGEVSRMLGLDR